MAMLTLDYAELIAAFPAVPETVAAAKTAAVLVEAGSRCPKLTDGSAEQTTANAVQALLWDALMGWASRWRPLGGEASEVTVTGGPYAETVKVRAGSADVVSDAIWDLIAALCGDSDEQPATPKWRFPRPPCDRGLW